MNAVEIEEAISKLATEPFDGAEFPYAFLQAFGNKETTIKKLRAGDSNKSDLGGVLQRNNIHIAVSESGEVSQTIAQLKTSPATAKAKSRYILATDGVDFEAEDLETGETVACTYPDFPNHFGFFLPLAGISTVKQIRESSFDIRATGRLNKLYIELLKDNTGWGSAERSHDMNHFMARLIFCFFAEDTDIFAGKNLFTGMVDQMSARDSSNTHEVIGGIFLAMNTPYDARKDINIPRWANNFPYVNGGLFSGILAVPTFSKIARSYLLHIGSLDWTKINPDIFGSMIQAVADDEERSSLGMHYTSVPNILKVLNPLFLDDLRAQLEAAADNTRILLNLRKRISKIRVFDPACGSGNFLVIAYKQMREIENTLNERRGESGRKSDIPLTNFRGIELRDFPAEIARLALIIAEYQCDLIYRGQKEALDEFLPLDSENWITCGNALRLDWLSICPPTGSVSVSTKTEKFHTEDMFDTSPVPLEIDFENEGGETYICGNPPYLGSVLQSEDQKIDLKFIFDKHTNDWKSLDYVAGWFFKAAEYGMHTSTVSAFVSTNSICQGEQVPILWPLIFSTEHSISFAYRSFKWSNLASYNAGVTVVIVGLSASHSQKRKLFDIGSDGIEHLRLVDNIGPYLVPGANITVHAMSSALDGRGKMIRGNMPNDGGHLVLNAKEAELIRSASPSVNKFIKEFIGSKEFINSTLKYCLWLNDTDVDEAIKYQPISERINKVRESRLKGGKQARDNASTPHRFVFAPHQEGSAIIVPRVSSENRDYLPVGITNGGAVVSERNFVLYNASLWNMALIASRLHWVWIGALSARLEMRFSYANTLCWNTFPIPTLTEKNKDDLTICAEDILLSREAHFPATIADLYDHEHMPADLREAHERNDETLERIYIGRRFKNDTERLEKLFELYTKMTLTSVKTNKRKLGADA